MSLTRYELHRFLSLKLNVIKWWREGLSLLLFCGSGYACIPPLKRLPMRLAVNFEEGIPQSCKALWQSD